MGKVNRIKYLITTCIMGCSLFASAQRNYQLVFSQNLRGNTTICGNTLLQIIQSPGVADTMKMNDNSITGNSIYGNDNENMQYVDIDGSTGDGASTRNSSAADLQLPQGNTIIKFARLYWGGRVTNSQFNLALPENQAVKIRKGTSGIYENVKALLIDQSTISAGYTQYQAYADITNFITQNGAGTYSVGNVPLTTGSISGGGNNGGWCIVVVYENSLLNYNSIRVYDGFEKVYNDGMETTNSVTLTGLDVPSGILAASDAQMSVMAWEGDANIKGDFLKINGILFSNETNPVDNPWNGTISNNGMQVHSRYPDFSNQMGMDIDVFNVGDGYNIIPNSKEVMLDFGTEADQYYPGVFMFSIKMKDPSITVGIQVKDENNNHLAESGEQLTYTISGANSGQGNANFIVLTDTLPSGVTYLPNSLQLINSAGLVPGPLTDTSGDDVAEFIKSGNLQIVRFRIGNGANDTTGGTLLNNQDYSVQFKVTVNQVPAGSNVPSITNIVRINSLSDAGISFVDDATAIINPEEGPLPLIFMDVTAQKIPGAIAVQWTTAQEINCKEFRIERSENGIVFKAVANVPAQGSGNSLKQYEWKDKNIPAISKVYYRVKQLDIDSTFQYSKTVSVNTENIESIKITPGIIHSSLNITITGKLISNATINIFTMDGRLVYSKNAEFRNENELIINDVNRFSSGMYLIQVISTNHRFIKKFIKD
ncbi:MAG: T9SS type A sorting domain-containing protein [Ginsengibacter sp.]